jgi:hypothetical protein
LELNAPLDHEPPVALEPDHAPEAAQEVALVVDQVSVVVPPLVTVLGLAESFTVAVGRAVTVTVAVWTAVPPDPVQLKV